MPIASAGFDRIALIGFDIDIFFSRKCEEKKCNRSINTRSCTFPSVSASVNEIISPSTFYWQWNYVVGYRTRVLTRFREGEREREEAPAGKPVAR